MAGGLLRKLLEENCSNMRVEVSSAGTAALDGLPATLYAQEAVKRFNVDISSHRSRMITREIILESDIILTMTRKHKEHLLQIVPEARSKVFVLSEYSGTGLEQPDIPDPIGGPLEVYVETAQKIYDLLRHVVARICHPQ